VLFAVLLLFGCVLVRVCVELKLRAFVCVCFWGVCGACMYLGAGTSNVGHVWDQCKREASDLVCVCLHVCCCERFLALFCASQELCVVLEVVYLLGLISVLT
jgi:hypothetical protein